MKTELLAIENGRTRKNSNIVFQDLCLRLFLGDITGIVFDEIMEQKVFLELLTGDLMLENGRIYVEEQRKDYQEAAKIIHKQVTVIGSQSKLLPSLTVEDNIFLFSDEKVFLYQREYRERLQTLCQQFDLSVKLSHKVRQLTTKERIMTELLKAYEESRRIVILDEITGTLSEQDQKDIFLLINKMKDKMTFLVTIGLEDSVVKWLDSILIVQNGRTAFSCSVDQMTRSFGSVLWELAGKQEDQTLKPDYNLKMTKKCTDVMEIRNVSTSYLDQLFLIIKAGEVLKIYYADEQDKKCFWNLLSGVERIYSGEIYLEGKLYRAKGMNQAVRQGIGFITEAPYRSMMLDNMGILENVSIPLHEKVKGFWFFGKYSKSVKAISDIGGLKCKRLKNISVLQRQKLAYEKWLIYQPKIVVIENPFTDMDIHMRDITFQMICALQKKGISVILLTANFATIGKIRGRTLFLRHGKLTDANE